MIKRSRLRSIWLAASLMIAFSPALGQPAAPPPAAAPDPAYDAAQKIFDAWPENERKAVQEALIWTGDFNATLSGAYGKRTQAAVNSYAKRHNLPQNGLLDDKARAALAVEMAAAKKAAAFAPVADKASGIVIAVPAKYLPKATPGKAGARYAAPDNSASLETFALPPAESDLAALFEREKADQPGRKVTYKLLRPDFYVVTGETGGQIYYTRVAKGAPGLRGYTLSYAPAAKPTFDKLVIAIANSFDPFPAAAPPATALAPAAPPPPAVQKPVLETTGLIVGSGLILAAWPANGCNDPATNKVKARVVKQDSASGLALLEAAGVAGKPLALGAAKEGAAVVLFFQPSGGQALLAAAAGEVFGAAPARLRAPLASGQTGGIAFDRSGALIGLLRAKPQLTAGPALPASYEIVPAAGALAFAGVAAAPAAAQNRTVGEIVAAAGGLVTPIFCTR